MIEFGRVPVDPPIPINLKHQARLSRCDTIRARRAATGARQRIPNRIAVSGGLSSSAQRPSETGADPRRHQEPRASRACAQRLAPSSTPLRPLGCTHARLAQLAAPSPGIGPGLGVEFHAYLRSYRQTQFS